MSSRAGQSAQTGESHSLAPRRPDIADPQLADRREGGVRILQRSIGNSALVSLLQQQAQALPAPTPAVHAALRTPGRPLDSSVRAEMESRLQEDFSTVRVHADAAAAKAANSVNAVAFTIGDDLVFNGNRYSPLQESGKRLLAHELAHVVQQRRGGPAPAGHVGAALEQSADRTAAAVLHGSAPVRVDGRSARAIARQAKDSDWAYADVQVVEVGTDRVVVIEGVPVIHLLNDPSVRDVYIKIDVLKSESEKTVKFVFDTNLPYQPIYSAVNAFKKKGYRITGDPARKPPVQLGEHPYQSFDGPRYPNSDTIPLDNSLPPFPLRPTPKPPPKPAPRPHAPAKKASPPPTPKKEEQKTPDLPPLPAPTPDLPQLPAPLQADAPAPQTQLPPTPPTPPAAQNLAPQPQVAPIAIDETWNRGEDSLQQPFVPNSDSPSSREFPNAPETIEHAIQRQITSELLDIEPIVAKLQTDVEDSPKDVVLNVARGNLQRLKEDQQFVEEFEKRNGMISADGQATIARFKELRQIMEGVVAKAEKWHADNDAGKSLGMYNEQAGTYLAGVYESETDKGGIHYVSGGAAIVGAFLVAFVDSGEKLISFGYHDTATAVAEAYARGDISWNEGEDILGDAAVRAILTAAITRGAGAATSSLGKFAATGVGLAPRTLSFGLVAGSVSGGLGAATALTTQSLLTKGLEGNFTNPQARAIWDQGLPQGKDWAIAIPLGIFLGGLGGVNEVKVSNAARVSNQQLVGTVVDTPEGQLRVAEVTNDGRVILKPVSAITEVPPPPAATINPTPDPVAQAPASPQPPPSPKPPPNLRPATSSAAPARTVTDSITETSGTTAPARASAPAPAAQDLPVQEGQTVSPSGDGPVKTLEANPDQAVATAKPAAAPQAGGDAPVQNAAEANKVTNPDDAVKSETAPPKNENNPPQNTSETPEAAKLKQRLSALDEQRLKVQKDLDGLRAKEGALRSTVEKETKLANDLEKQIRTASAEQRANLRAAQTEAYRRRLAANAELEKVASGTDELAQLRRIERETNQVTRELFKGSKPWRSVDLGTADNAQVGIYGELETTSRMQAKGFEAAGKTVNPEDIVTPAELDAATKAWHGQQGIDGIYKRVNPETGKTEYWAGESKATGIDDATTPTGKGKIDSTLDGDQLSNEWLRSRLAKSGLSPAEQAEFEQALKAGQVRKFYSQTTKNGTRFYNVIDRSNTEIELGAEITQF